MERIWSANLSSKVFLPSQWVKVFVNDARKNLIRYNEITFVSITEFC